LAPLIRVGGSVAQRLSARVVPDTAITSIRQAMRWPVMSVGWAKAC